MTFIQPHRHKDVFIAAAILLFVFLFTGVVWLIFLYNQTVNFRQSAVGAREQTKKVQLQNAELKEKTLSFLEGKSSEQFATEHNLVQDKNPRYLRASNDKLWVFASRF